MSHTYMLCAWIDGKFQTISPSPVPLDELECVARVWFTQRSALADVKRTIPTYPVVFVCEVVRGSGLNVYSSQGGVMLGRYTINNTKIEWDGSDIIAERREYLREDAKVR